MNDRICLPLDLRHDVDCDDISSKFIGITAAARSFDHNPLHTLESKFNDRKNTPHIS